MNDMELAEEIERQQTSFFSRGPKKITRPPGTVTETVELSRSEWQQIIAALRRADLAQTEIKGHMRIQDDLKAECFKLAAGSCVHELVGDPYGHFECSKVIEIERGLTLAASTITAFNRKLAEAQSRIAELEKDAARYRWLRQWANRGDELAALNLKEPETPEDIDAAIDAALKDRA